ncbi:MAG: VTT domain-containing protein [Coriobacteriia bacterium]|nr:VTT domain-containing protein [Coriobacteriia bacterium]
MSVIDFLLELLRDPRSFIADWISQLGPVWAYAPLAVIIFLETGLVFMPFLPGDSILFAAGVFATPGGGLNIYVLIIVCALAAILGDTSNYWIGRKLGSAIIASGKVKSLTPQRMDQTQAMLDKYGSLAVVLARFFPFIRTFAPFLAGFGHMRYSHFMTFNAIGGSLWVSLFTLLGYFFGGIPFVQAHFEWVVIAIVVISLIPTLVGLVRVRLNKKQDK